MASYDLSYTQNRELSWLDFNIRVLEEAHDPDVPDLENLNFISIFLSNLEEFFMVRVGSLMDLSKIKEQVVENKSGMTNKEQLEAIFKRIPELYKKKDKAYEEVENKLRNKGIYNLTYGELTQEEKNKVDKYFEENILPIVSPLTFDSRHPFPNFLNNNLYIICEVNIEGDNFIGVVPKPLASKDYFIIKKDNELRYILTEEIIKGNLDQIFQNKTRDKAVISVTRNADLDLEEGLDEFDDDIRKHMRKSLKKRRRLEPVRLQINGDISRLSLIYLQENLNLTDTQTYYTKTPIVMNYSFELANHLSKEMKKDLLNKPFTPQISTSINPSESIINQIEKEDKLLFYPYESMDSFLQLLKESAADPDVISIKITIYRLASLSKVAEQLAFASENGKEVVVLMELKARFDEDNNIRWSERLEESGCTVIYGFEGYKVHSKICLITRHKDGEIQYISQFGTGNYNEKTSKQYTDLSLMTANKDLGKDAQKFFNNMMIGNLDGEYTNLLVAPNGLKPKIIQYINQEIEKAKEGKKAKIWVKCNSVTERDIIDKLAEASQAGVEIFMNVRGICCIVPGIKGKTDNIKITSIVGRYLEHPRIYIFGVDNPKIYISSADLMTRNLQRRVEIACPILEENTRNKTLKIAEIIENDDRKSRILQSDGTYTRSISENPLSAQDKFMEITIKNAQEKISKITENKEDSLVKIEAENINELLEEKISNMSFIEKLKKLFFN